MLTSAGVPLPPMARFTDETGAVDEAAYANALLDRVAALGQVLTGSGTDRQAAAFGLLDGLSTPIGAGPYRVTRSCPGSGWSWLPCPGVPTADTHQARRASRSCPDPAVAATRLLGGDVDWIPQRGSEPRGGRRLVRPGGARGDASARRIVGRRVQHPRRTPVRGCADPGRVHGRASTGWA